MTKCLKVEDALSYLDQVKARFSGQGAIYMDFLDVMREFKAQTIGTEMVIRRVRELFEGHPDLITGFNSFIPQGYRMDAVPSSTHQPSSQRSQGCVPTNVRTTLSSSGTDNISPVKSYNSSLKSNETTHDWLPNSTLAPSATSLNECFNRPPAYTSAASITGVSPPVRATTPALQTDNSSYSSTNQHLFTTSYQENYPNIFIRNSNVVPPSISTQSSHPPMHIQQQQTQSFNHALHYVNKIKNRFLCRPDVYKRFLDILQWYQKEQRHSDLMRRKQAELQVYQDVADLFDGQEDLLQEFGQFLPESTGVTNAVTDTIVSRKSSTYTQLPISDSQDQPVSATPPANRPAENISAPVPCRQRQSTENINSPPIPSNTQLTDTRKLKRVAPASVPTNVLTNNVTTKKARLAARDVGILDLNQLTTSLEVNLLHEIRELLEGNNTSGGHAYQTFLQSLSLFNRNMISADEFSESVRPLFPRNTEVWKRLSDVVSSTLPRPCRENTINLQSHGHLTSACKDRDKHDRDKRTSSLSPDSNAFPETSNHLNQPVGPANATLMSLVSEVSQKRLDLDFNKLRTCGASYRALPPNFPQSKCSGRLKCPIAKEVLNDTYISFSSLTSEDSQFVSSKKNQYEENIYRVEDERYEVDMVTELNRTAMENLVVVNRQMSNMTRDELNHFHLDDKLGGTSAILMKKAIHRVYGDKAGDVIYGLKNCPNTVVPLVIERMHQKDKEWRETIRVYQRSWADQDARNYLRSLDHQGATFKQRDAPFIRSKTMVSQIEAIARNDKANSPHTNFDHVGRMISSSLSLSNFTLRDVNNPGSIGSALANVVEGNNEGEGPHLMLIYPPAEVRQFLLEDAASLIIHHVKRQSNASKDDKRAMKYLIRTVVQDIFMSNRFPMSDDEDEDDEDEDIDCKNEDDEVIGEGGEAEESNRGRSSRHCKPKSRRNIPSEISTSTTDHCESMEQFRSDNARSDGAFDQIDNRLNRTDSCGIQSTSDTSCIYEKSQPGQNISKYPTDDEVRSMELAYISNLPKQEAYSLLFGNNHWYAFLRLHHLLLCRLHQLRSRGLTAALQATLEYNESHTQAAEVLRLRRCGGVEPAQYYNRALNLVKDLLDGGEDIATYEDRLRDMFGIYAYPWFTMDRLIINIVRQLQALASGDELSRRLTALHRSWTTGFAVNTSNVNFANAGGSQLPNLLNMPQYTGVSGPLYTRICRLSNETAYHSQAMSICMSFAGPNNNNSSSNMPNSQTGCPVGSTGTSNTTTTNGNSSNFPNCYSLVMLTEASTMLIRLIRPASAAKSEFPKATGPCQSAYPGQTNPCSSQLLRRNHYTIGNDRDNDSLKQIISIDNPVRHWSDYLRMHFLCTQGFVSPKIASRIRPVFSFRTIRRSVASLTRRALRRRQLSMIESGDTQPEELLVRGLRDSENRAPNSIPVKDQEPIYDSTIESSSLQNSLSTSVDFKRDVWEFMCMVFKNDLTLKELFDDTFSTDCMQSTERLVAKSARNHKINWSVGSYGIFIRRREQHEPQTYSPEKWRTFHSTWLAEHVRKTEPPDVTDSTEHMDSGSEHSELKVVVESNEEDSDHANPEEPLNIIVDETINKVDPDEKPPDPIECVSPAPSPPAETTNTSPISTEPANTESDMQPSS